MTLDALKSKIREYQYLEDDGMIDVALAASIATRLNIGDPIWMIYIGPSSGGKSQLLRPLALSDSKFMHKVDDLTENTFLSGAPSKDKNLSLLQRIGPVGMIVISDLTVLFSKNSEAKNAILSQFRMIYDGEMTKYSGTSDTPITWKGRLGVLAGATPSVYSHFEDVADMGERFIYWRMKPQDEDKAAHTALGRKKNGKEIDTELAEAYGEYIREEVTSWLEHPLEIEIPDTLKEDLIEVAKFAEKARTTAHMDFREVYINKIPVPAMCMRVALQLVALAKGLYVMRNGVLTDKDTEILRWCGWSLANEERRAVLKTLASVEFDRLLSTQAIADGVGLPTEAVNRTLAAMASVGIVKRTADVSSLRWGFALEKDWELVRKICNIGENSVVNERLLSAEEAHEQEMAVDATFDAIRA